MPKNDKNKGQKITIWVVSSLTIIVVFLIVDWQRLFEQLKLVDIKSVFFALLFFIINYIFRAIRLNYILNLNWQEFPKLLKIIGIYGSLNYLVPFKLGEFSLPIMLQNEYSLSKSRSFSVLVLLKIADLFFIIFCAFGLVLVDIQLLISLFGFFGVTSATAIIFSLFILVIALSYCLRDTKPIKSLLKELKKTFKKLDIKLILLTFGVWLMLNLQTYFLLRSIINDVSLGFVFLLNLIGLLLTTLPIQGFANLGNYELSWVIASAGMETDIVDKLTMATLSHFLLTFLVVLMLIFTLFNKTPLKPYIKVTVWKN